jgi:hypothetical protein
LSKINWEFIIIVSWPAELNADLVLIQGRMRDTA